MSMDLKRELISLNINNLEVISKIHMAAFPTSSWSRLGKTVVEKYYLWQLNDQHPLVSAKSYMIENKCAGFCFSGIFKDSTSGFISRNKNLLIKKALFKPWLILYPEFRNGLLISKKLLKHFRLRQKAQINDNIQPRINDSYGILSIAVHPDFQGYGVGKILLNHAELYAHENNFKKMHLTVNVKNNAAIGFYEKLGWEKVSIENLWRGRMEKVLINNT